MAHPLDSDNPLVWMPALLALSDGDRVETLETVPPGDGPLLSWVALVSYRSTFREDVFATDSHGFELTTSVTPQLLGSGIFASPASSWTVSVLLYISAFSGACDIVSCNSYYAAAGDAGVGLSVLATPTGGIIYLGAGTNIGTLSSGFPTSTIQCLHFVGDSGAGVVRVYRTVSGTTTLMATSSAITVPALGSVQFVNHASANCTRQYGTISVVPKACNTTELTSVGDWIVSLDDDYVNYPRNLTLTGLVVGSEVRVYDESDDSEIGGIESVTATTWTTPYTQTPTVTIVVHKPGQENIRHEGLTLSSSFEGTTIPISQRVDRNYSNP